MKCDLCNGTGKLLKNWYDTTGLMTNFKGDVCFMCDGKGTIGEPITNKEWLHTLNTEQLADWLKEHMDCVSCGCKTLCRQGHDCKLALMEWLKQQHKPIS